MSKGKDSRTMTMHVASLRWHSESAEEAELEITDGYFSCVAFSQPCRVKVGDEIREPLHVFDVHEAMLSVQTELGIKQIAEGSLGQKVIAKVIDVPEQLLEVGGIRLVVDDPLPSGLVLRSTIQFECARIDLW